MGLMSKQTSAQMVEYVQCSYDVEHFFAAHIRVRDKTGEYKHPDHFENQKLMLKDLDDPDHSNLFIKYRQAGGTTTVLSWLLHKALFTPNFGIIIGADRLNQATEMLSVIRGMHNGLPEHLQQVYETNSKSRIRFSNGSTIQVTAVTRDGVRGFGPDIIFIDEINWCRNIDDFLTAALGALQAGGKIIAMTTPGNQDGIIKRLQQNTKVKTRVLHWFNDPRFSQNLRWEKTFLGFHGAVIGNEVLHEQSKYYWPKLLQAGYAPHSDWTDEMRKNYYPDNDWFDNHIASDYYLPKQKEA